MDERHATRSSEVANRIYPVAIGRQRCRSVDAAGVRTGDQERPEPCQRVCAGRRDFRRFGDRLMEQVDDVELAGAALIEIQAVAVRREDWRDPEGVALTDL